MCSWCCVVGGVGGVCGVGGVGGVVVGFPLSSMVKTSF